MDYPQLKAAMSSKAYKIVKAFFAGCDVSAVVPQDAIEQFISDFEVLAVQLVQAKDAVVHVGWKDDSIHKCIYDLHNHAAKLLLLERQHDALLRRLEAASKVVDAAREVYNQERREFVRGELGDLDALEEALTAYDQTKEGG